MAFIAPWVPVLTATTQGVADLGKVRGLKADSSIVEWTQMHKHLGGCHFAALTAGVGDRNEHLVALAEHWEMHLGAVRGVGGKEDAQIGEILKGHADEIDQARRFLGAAGVEVVGGEGREGGGEVDELGRQNGDGGEWDSVEQGENQGVAWGGDPEEDSESGGREVARKP